MRALPTFSDFSFKYRRVRKLENDTQRIVALMGKEIYQGPFLFSEYLKDPALSIQEKKYLRESGFQNPNDACVRYFLIKYFKAKADYLGKGSKDVLEDCTRYYQKRINKLTRALHAYYEVNYSKILSIFANPEYRLRIFYEAIERGYIPKSLIEAEPGKYYLRLNLTYHIFLPKPFKSQTEASFSGWSLSGFTGSELLAKPPKEVSTKVDKKITWI